MTAARRWSSRWHATGGREARAGSGAALVAALLLAGLVSAPPATAALGGAGFEAEAATLSGAVVAGAFDNASGDRYVDFDPGPGRFIEWQVPSDTSRRATLGVRFANFTEQDRPMAVAVNGATVAAALSFPPTADWSTWIVQTISVQLVAGVNRVRVTATVPAGGPNVDVLIVSAPPDTRYEAEAATLTRGVPEAVHAGFTGAGYVNTDNVVGASVSWPVSFPVAGVGRDGPTVPNPEQLVVRYANGTGADRPMDLVTDGVVVARDAFPSTGSWTTWRERTLTFVPGGFPVELVAVTAGGGPNIDSLTVRGHVQPAAPMRVARAGHTATLLADGRVLVVGGNAEGPSVERYDPKAGTWTAAASIPTPRTGHEAVRLPDGRVLITGGFAPDGSPRTAAELYDPVANSWTRAAPAPRQPLGTHRSVVLGDGRVLVVTSGPAGQLYQPTTNTWTVTGPRRSRAYRTLTVLPGGRALAVGGDEVATVHEGAAGFSRDLFDPASGTWAVTASVPLSGPTVAAALGAKVLVVGLAMEEPDCESDGCNTAEVEHIYDPVAKTWTKVPGRGPEFLGSVTATTLMSGDVVVVGRGGCCFGSSVPIAEVIHRNGTVSDVTGSYEERGAHASVRLADGRVLITGGEFGPQAEFGGGPPGHLRPQVDVYVP